MISKAVYFVDDINPLRIDLVLKCFCKAANFCNLSNFPFN